MLAITPTEVERYCVPVPFDSDELPPPLRLHRALQGCLFGTAVGDALGLPYEGLSPVRAGRLYRGPLRYRFLPGAGMLSDDTEHTCMTAQALILSGGQPDRFASALAWRLRWWLLGLPAGVGLATLRACLKLWLGQPAPRSGVNSAGNGPAMRSAIVGVYTHDDRALRERLVSIDTTITHRDLRALKGALVVAELAALNASGERFDTDNCLERLRHLVEGDVVLKSVVESAAESARHGQSATAFCQNNGQSKGVSGYIYDTLPVVLQIVLRHNDNFEQAITEAIACGGDTDTVAAIVGGIVGANTGTAGIPERWLRQCRDWPRDKFFIRVLGEELAMMKITGNPARCPTLDIVRIWLRNAVFMIAVLFHGLRRLLPPY